MTIRWLIDVQLEHFMSLLVCPCFELSSQNSCCVSDSFLDKAPSRSDLSVTRPIAYDYQRSLLFGTALLSIRLSMLADERRVVQLTVETILPVVSNPIDYLLSILVAG